MPMDEQQPLDTDPNNEHSSGRNGHDDEIFDVASLATNENSGPILPDLKGSALLDVLNRSGVRNIIRQRHVDLGYAENLPFPFIALVGQLEMRFALLLNLINPQVGGVLLIGPRGVGKTTCVRSLTTIAPDIEVPDDDVLPEDLPLGEPIPTHLERVKLIELPLNARLEDVVGGVNERVAVQQNRIVLERGILARADRNLLYIDEVNLLDKNVVDAILDAAAQGHYTVRRGAMAGTFRARFVLIGSMNPEEGQLRPQIMDRFGLRVVVAGLETVEERLEVYKRVKMYRDNPQSFLQAWAGDTADIREYVGAAQDLLKVTTIDDDTMEVGIRLVHNLNIESTRAEFTLFEAARAHAAADGRNKVEISDLRFVAPLALRQRRSEFITRFVEHQQREDDGILQAFNDITGDSER